MLIISTDHRAPHAFSSEEEQLRRLELIYLIPCHSKVERYLFIKAVPDSPLSSEMSKVVGSEGVADLVETLVIYQV